MSDGQRRPLLGATRPGGSGSRRTTGLLIAVAAEHQVQAWMVDASGGVCVDLDADPRRRASARPDEEERA